eukprot:CAMPEP_0114581272 /NCGR_PEP_ID=MMETSP0125-20121206/5403_1 /TAXON_ID=485358 ORGANISM="Aristerostoma sp., Strain ATCC 50986" /NCGR_SAMPLE_ID=MMETSP0125 /ASSEMBLY_ACC=CAM_ASM_000245 /LENGTH=129 /DNA_ID=CAMNT_0001773359 /DNA_START=677 /DNA_END=1066 /DNA_ORIENTATION=+
MVPEIDKRFYGISSKANEIANMIDRKRDEVILKEVPIPNSNETKTMAIKRNSIQDRSRMKRNNPGSKVSIGSNRNNSDKNSRRGSKTNITTSPSKHKKNMLNQSMPHEVHIAGSSSDSHRSLDRRPSSS